MDREKRLFTGKMIEGNFEENTMKFKIDGDMILQAGDYTIMLSKDFTKLSEPATTQLTRAKALPIHNVSRLFDIGEKVTIIDKKEDFGEDANKEKEVTGLIMFGTEQGYRLDNDKGSIFLLEDFK